MVNELHNSLIWMFVGSVIITLLFDGMNVMAYRFNDIYLSTEMIYMALFMASNMCILEVIMHSEHTGLAINPFLFFIIMSLLLVVLMRGQYGVNDNQWLRRMIGHHSVALTTSHKILKSSKDHEIKKLASNIIQAQEKEIVLMKKILTK